MTLINATKSLCPECFKVVDAQVIQRFDQVYICKTCQEHGYFEAVHPLGSPRHYRALENLFRDRLPGAYSDGLVVSLILRCNLNCPFCFARVNEYEAREPSLEEIKKQISGFPGSTIYLSGGEPTLREDLFKIICEIKKFKYKVALFTNGKKLLDKDFTYQLKKTGLDLVILQFDTFDEDQCKLLRGEKLIEVKLKVIELLRQVQMPLYLFAMLAKGINMDQVERLVKFAVKNSGFIKILNLNPVWETGRVGKHDPMNMSEISKVVEEKTNLSCEDFIEGSAFSYYSSSIYRQLTGKDGNKHSWCEMRCYVFPDDEKVDVFSQAVDIKKLNQHLKKISERLQRSTRFRKIKLLISLPYYFLIKEFFSRKKFRKLFLRIIKCLFSSMLKYGKFSFRDFEVTSIIIGTFHTALNIDLNLVNTCNLHSYFPDGQYRSSCLKQIFANREFEAALDRK